MSGCSLLFFFVCKANSKEIVLDFYSVKSILLTAKRPNPPQALHFVVSPSEKHKEPPEDTNFSYKRLSPSVHAFADFVDVHVVERKPYETLTSR